MATCCDEIDHLGVELETFLARSVFTRYDPFQLSSIPSNAISLDYTHFRTKEIKKNIDDFIASKAIVSFYYLTIHKESCKLLKR